MTYGWPVNQGEGGHGEKVMAGKVFLYEGGAEGK